MRLPGPLALALSLLLAGCTGTPPDDGDGHDDDHATPPAGPGIPAPWWDPGEWWTLVLSRDGGPPATYRMAHYLNDSATRHFWLGVPDRAQALDHALFDTNPFLGRMHWEILAPHETGQHADMYNFPMEAGERWQGFLLGGDWSFTSRVDDEGRLWVDATGSTGHHLTYDYDEENRWFSTLTRTDETGVKVLEARITDHGFGATGTYWFLRGRDFYRGPETGSGTHDETFSVDEEVDKLAIHIDVTTSGTARLDILDPSGQTVEEVTLATGGSTTKTVEIPDPIPQGTWTARYVLTGTLEGEVFSIGLLESSGTL